MFTVVRVYSDDQGDSHFEEVVLSLEDKGDIGQLSALYPSEGVYFREVAPNYDFDFHTAPHRQFIVLLDGEIEIETSLGEKRSFKGGEVLLMEDTTGKGHKTRNLLPQKRKSIFIVLGEGYVV